MSSRSWPIFVVLAIAVGLYPLRYVLAPSTDGLLETKSAALLASQAWWAGLYGHVVAGGVALAIGWAQFRRRRTRWHRRLGYAYLAAVAVAAPCGIAIGVVATGGLVAQTGFVLLGAVWLAATARAYLHVRAGDHRRHEAWMIVSYAACFAAVTLRLWLPLLTALTGDFVAAYRVVAWLCWLPNLVVAGYLVRRRGLLAAVAVARAPAAGGRP